MRARRVLLAVVVVALFVALARACSLREPPATASRSGTVAAPRDGGTSLRGRPVRGTDGGSDPSAELAIPWGSEPGSVGRRLASESNPEVPMALAVASDGSLLVVDQVHRRLQRFRDGALTGMVALPTAAAQDVAVGRDGTVAVLDRLVGASVALFDAEGAPRGSVPITVGSLREGGASSAVFVDREGVWVEREHQEVVRVADADGRPDPSGRTLWGRPTRDGRALLRARIVDRLAGVAEVSAADRANGAMDWRATVRLEGLVLHLVLLDADLAGNVYVGAAVGREEPGPPPSLADVRTEVRRINRSGEVDGALRLPALPEDAEVVRPLAVSDDGTLHMMEPGPGGLVVRRYGFPRP